MRRPLLLPLVPVYAAVLWLKRRFAGEPKQLHWPVVSVGSLSAGGAGKTPVVLALAELLVRQGYAVDVLSRGYKRASQTVERVDREGPAAQFGDEPIMLARAGSRVYVGSERYAAGVFAEREFSGERLVHLLDDGFQHRLLTRALDVVLLTREDVADWLLPAGNLREPLGRLRVAGAVVLREDEAETLLPVVRRLAGDVQIWVVRRQLAVEGVSRRPLAFCGIARPEGFYAMLAAAGIETAGAVSFGDHHPYTGADLRRLLDEARRRRADGFVTTEKDAVKITGQMRATLGAQASFGVARLRVDFLDEGVILDTLKQSVSTKSVQRCD